MARSAKTCKIRKGDLVQVISGKDRGKRGVVERVLPAERRVVVEGVNIIKRHTKPRPPANPQQVANDQQRGGVIERPAPIHISNVAVVSGASDKPTRVGYRTAEDGRKLRVAKRDNIDIDETRKGA